MGRMAFLLQNFRGRGNESSDQYSVFSNQYPYTLGRHSRPREGGEHGNPGNICYTANFFLGPRLALRALGDDARGGVGEVVILWSKAKQNGG